jgi:hypothetical protein
MRLQTVRINPLGIASGVLLLSAPFGAWMTLSAFGFVSESNLWGIANSQTSFPIGTNVASTALYSALILIVAGLISIRRAKIGLPLATAAVLFFGLESYSTFGTFPGPIPVSILPGTGFALALCGIALGLGALRTGEMPVMRLLFVLRTRKGLGEAGILLASVFLAADGWSHWSSGQLSGFLGVTLLEGVIHRVFLLGVGFLFMMFLAQRSMFFERTGGVLTFGTFSALILDAVYHFSTGSVVGFVGHDGLEILFHALTYYGVALLVTARLLLKS